MLALPIQWRTLDPYKFVTGSSQLTWLDWYKVLKANSNIKSIFKGILWVVYEVFQAIMLDEWEVCSSAIIPLYQMRTLY